MDQILDRDLVLALVDPEQVVVDELFPARIPLRDQPVLRNVVEGCDRAAGVALFIEKRLAEDAPVEDNPLPEAVRAVEGIGALERQRERVARDVVLLAVLVLFRDMERCLGEGTHHKSGARHHHAIAIEVAGRLVEVVAAERPLPHPPVVKAGRLDALATVGGKPEGRFKGRPEIHRLA